MSIKALLSPNQIQLVDEKYSKKSILEMLSQLLADSCPQQGLSAKHLLEQFIARERLGTTALGHGVALPHIRCANIQKPICGLLISKQGVDFGSMDHQLVRLFFGLAVPETATAEHLDILSSVAETLSQPDIRQQLLLCNHADEVYQVLTTQAQTITHS